MACVLVWRVARSERPEGPALRDLLVRLSGRQVRRGVTSLCCKVAPEAQVVVSAPPLHHCLGLSIEIENGLVRDADRIIATCSDELFELVRLGADPACVDIVPCGVDLSLFRPDGPVEERAPKLRRAVIVSRFVERKGIGNAISAIARVPRCELMIAGGPPLERLHEDSEARRYVRTAEAHGISDRVHFLGSVPRDRVPALLRSADVAICVPWYEPFGIVPLEAMACGVPVLATAVGGLTDTVVDGVTGFHIPPRRPRAPARRGAEETVRRGGRGARALALWLGHGRGRDPRVVRPRPPW